MLYLNPNLLHTLYLTGSKKQEITKGNRVKPATWDRGRGQEPWTWRCLWPCTGPCPFEPTSSFPSSKASHFRTWSPSWIPGFGPSDKNNLSGDYTWISRMILSMAASPLIDSGKTISRQPFPESEKDCYKKKGKWIYKGLDSWTHQQQPMFH